MRSLMVLQHYDKKQEGLMGTWGVKYKYTKYFIKQNDN